MKINGRIILRKNSFGGRNAWGKSKVTSHEEFIKIYIVTSLIALKFQKIR